MIVFNTEMKHIRKEIRRGRRRLWFGKFLLLAVLAAAVGEIWALVALPIPFIFIIVGAVRLNRYKKIRKQYKRIQNTPEVYTETVAKPKTKILLAKKGCCSRARKCLGFIIKEKAKTKPRNKAKYVYIFRDPVVLKGKKKRRKIKQIKKEFARELHLQCHNGTTVLRTAEKEAAILRIAYGSGLDQE